MTDQVDDANANANANTNGSGTALTLDLKATKAALTSSSTSSRIAQLRVVDDKISQNGMGFCCNSPQDLADMELPL